MFTSPGFGIAGRPGNEAAGPNVGSGRLLKGFCISGNKSPPKGVSDNTSLILSITSAACSYAFGAPIYAALISNSSATSLDGV